MTIEKLNKESYEVTPAIKGSPCPISSLPKEILLYIFSFLNWQTRTDVRLVCKAWNQIYAIMHEDVKATALMEAFLNNWFRETNHSEIYSLNTNARPEALFSLSDNQLAIQTSSNFQIFDVVSKKTQTFEQMRFLEKLNEWIFLKKFSKNSEETELICINSNNSDTIFEFKVQTDVDFFVVLSNDPLTFVIVSKKGAAEKWQFDGIKTKHLDSWNLFDGASQFSFKMHLSGFNLFISGIGKHGSETLEFTCLYSLQEKRRTELPFYLHSSEDVWCDESLIYLREKDKISCFHFQSTQFPLKWSIVGEFDSLKLVKDQKEKVILISDKETIYIVNPENGKLITTCARENGEKWHAKLHGHLLLIIFHGTYVSAALVNLSPFDKKDFKMTLFYWNTRNSIAYNVKDHELKKNLLYSLGELDVDRYPHPPAQRNMVIRVIKVPLSKKSNEKRVKELKDHLPNSHVGFATGLALQILSLLSFSLMIYFSTQHAITFAVASGVGTPILFILGALLSYRSREYILNNLPRFSSKPL